MPLPALGAPGATLVQQLGRQPGLGVDHLAEERQCSCLWALKDETF